MNYYRNILLEGRVEDAQRYFEDYVGSWPIAEFQNAAGIYAGTNLDGVLKHFINADPSGNNKYLMWMVKMYLNPEERGTAPSDISSLVQRFHKNVDRLTPEFMKEWGYGVGSKITQSPRDIESYEEISTLEHVMDTIDHISTKQQERKKAKSEIDRVYEDDTWLIIRPQSHRASCYYGRGTKWCTTTKDSDTYFEKYSEEGVLYYIIKKEKTSQGKDFKVALFKKFPSRSHRLVPDDEWYDEKDAKLGGQIVHMIKSMLPAQTIQVIDDLYRQELVPHQESLDFNRWMSLNRFTEMISEKLEGENILFNTESGTWSLEFVNRSEWYVNHVGETPISFSIDTFVDGEYEINVSDYQRTIKPTEENDLDEDVGWYFKILPEKIVEASRTLGYNELMNGKLGLPPRDMFKANFLDNEKYEGNQWRGWPEKTFLNNILIPNLRYLLSRPEVKELTQEDKVLWGPQRWRTPLVFRYPPKEGSLTQLFVDFVKNNPGKTRKEFYDHIGRTYTPGHNSEFFAVINNSGIVEMKRNGRQFVYVLGPNYETWKEGNLSRK